MLSGWLALVFAGSQTCTPPETRYAPIEDEAAAIAWSLEKSRIFVVGSLDLTTPHWLVFLGFGISAKLQIPGCSSWKTKFCVIGLGYSTDQGSGIMALMPYRGTQLLLWRLSLMSALLTLQRRMCYRLRTLRVVFVLWLLQPLMTMVMMWEYCHLISFQWLVVLMRCITCWSRQ